MPPDHPTSPTPPDDDDAGDDDVCPSVLPHYRRHCMPQQQHQLAKPNHKQPDKAYVHLAGHP